MANYGAPNSFSFSPPAIFRDALRNVQGDVVLVLVPHVPQNSSVAMLHACQVDAVQRRLREADRTALLISSFDIPPIQAALAFGG